jgi:hypothetical protein
MTRRALRELPPGRTHPAPQAADAVHGEFVVQHSHDKFWATEIAHAAGLKSPMDIQGQVG